LQGADPPANGIWVDNLDLTSVTIRRGRGQRGSTTPPPPLVYRLGGVTYPHALPLLSDGDVTIDLGGAATKFVAMIGVDDGPPPQAAPPPAQPGATPGLAPGPGAQRGPAGPPLPGSVVFGAWVDGRKAFESDVMHRGDAPKPVAIDLTGAQKLVLAVIDANDGTGGDNANWAGAAIIARPGQQDRIRIAASAVEPAPPIAPSRTAAPMINYPRITGATPGRPFLFRIPASGDGE